MSGEVRFHIDFYTKSPDKRSLQKGLIFVKTIIFKLHTFFLIFLNRVQRTPVLSFRGKVPKKKRIYSKFQYRSLNRRNQLGDYKYKKIIKTIDVWLIWYISQIWYFFRNPNILEERYQKKK